MIGKEVVKYLKQSGCKHSMTDNTNQGRESKEMPSGEWVNMRVSEGMIPVFDVLPDPDDPRLLRHQETGELVLWHNGRKDWRCPRKGIKPEEVVFDSNGAGWCPDCYKTNQDKARLKGIFG